MGERARLETRKSQIGKLTGKSKHTAKAGNHPQGNIWASLIAHLIKNPPAMQETLYQFLGWEDPLEKKG